MLKYQEALLKDRTRPGERDSSARWQLIQPLLPQTGLVLDVGSNLGYFGIRMTAASAGIAVVSLESDPQIISRQKAVLKSHQQTRVCAIQGKLNGELAEDWAQYCDWFDVTLLLSIIHWFDDPEKVVRALSSMSGKIIAEVPDHKDAGACGQAKLALWGADPVAWFAAVTQRPCRHLGRVSRHTSETESHMILIEGPLQRTSTQPYWDYAARHPEGNSYRFDFDGQALRFYRRDKPLAYRPGVNLVSLSKLGRLTWPRAKHWRAMGYALIDSDREHTDPRPHNMIWGPHGIEFIDKHDLDSGNQPAVVKGIFKRHIKNWAARPGAGSRHYVPALPRWKKLTWVWPKAVLRKMLPEKIFLAIKSRFSL